jgi:ribosome biogenesis protein YTM1
MSSDSDSDESDPGVQVRVSLKLAASVQDRSLEVPKEPIAVPADIGRKGLSAVLNHLLGRSVNKDDKSDDKGDSDSDEDEEDDGKLPPIPFEFIVAGTNNRLLRKGVEKEARQHGISLEEALLITYFPATTAPDLSDEQEELPDWVSCMTYNPSVLCSGCYDGTIHVYAQSGESLNKLHSAAIATGPIKAMGTTQRENQALWIAAASLDHSLSIHTYSAEHGLEAFGQCVQEDTSSAISSLDFSRSTTSSNLLLASGDGHGAIRLWDINAADGDRDSGASATKKKQKTASGKKVIQKEIKSRVTMESAHTQLISGVSWGNHSTDSMTHLISGSWDHSIKLWDVEKQDCLLTLNGSRVVSCLDTSYHTEGVVATGHPDCTIRLWDVRVQTTNQSAMVSDTTFRPSHKAWVSQVKWSPSNPYQLASTSHDGTVKLWDIRSSNPLHTVRVFPKEEKGMCLVWAPSTNEDNSKQHLFAGGTDRIIKHMKL